MKESLIPLGAGWAPQLVSVLLCVCLCVRGGQNTMLRGQALQRVSTRPSPQRRMGGPEGKSLILPGQSSVGTGVCLTTGKCGVSQRQRLVWDELLSKREAAGTG